jgi:metal-sulfur cluster biosynthetic enzyme
MATPRPRRDASSLFPAPELPADPRWALPATPARRVGENRVERAWGVLGSVPDPEVPALSVVDLGLVREIAETDAGLSVVVTPTYSGCPATEVINDAIRQALGTTASARSMSRHAARRPGRPTG